MIKRIIRFAAAAVLLTAQSAWGQTSSIQGSVVEAGDGSPIPNAVVLSAGSGSVLGSTDGQGKFSVRAAEGSALKFRAPGYSEATAPAPC